MAYGPISPARLDWQLAQAWADRHSIWEHLEP